CKVLVSPDAGADSAAWEYVLDAADERGVTFETPDAFDTYSLGGATVTVLSPSKDSIYSNLNDYSLVTMVEYGDTSVLLTGDAEKTVEKELLRSGYDLSADVLKCGHHGSNTSSCKEFLDAVSPSVAVISCGEGNDYGHPHREVLERLEERSIPIWRTDQDGTVVMSTDGKSISIKAEQKDGTALTASAAEKEEAKDGNTEIRQYMGNKNSKIFHSSDCKSAARTKEKNKVYFESREQAVLEGYSPCKECNP
ncbi:MAG: Ada metal-binding domain-containing protein, partial [Ruminococcus sp.]